MKNIYTFVVDQESYMIYCKAPNYEIANKLCEYVLNTSVMHIRTSSVYDSNKTQILLQQNLGMVRPGEGSVAKPSDIDEPYKIQNVDLQISHKTLQLQKSKKLLNLRNAALMLIYDMAEKFTSRYTTKYLNYTDEMIYEFAKAARISFYDASKYINWQNDCYNYGKAKIDGSIFRLIKEVDTINSKKDLDELKRKIDQAVYVN